MPGFFVELYFEMTKQEKDGILSHILDIPTPLKTVKMAPKNVFERVLIFLRIMKPKHEMLYLRGLKMSTNYTLTAFANGLSIESGKDGNVEQTFEIVHENTYQMAAYLATAIQNKKTPAPKYLINTIADEFTNTELKAAIEEVYRRLDVQSFFGCLELAGKLSLM